MLYIYLYSIPSKTLFWLPNKQVTWGGRFCFSIGLFDTAVPLVCQYLWWTWCMSIWFHVKCQHCFVAVVERPRRVRQFGKPLGGRDGQGKGCFLLVLACSLWIIFGKVAAHMNMVVRFVFEWFCCNFHKCIVLWMKATSFVYKLLAGFSMPNLKVWGSKLKQLHQVKASKWAWQ